MASTIHIDLLELKDIASDVNLYREIVTGWPSDTESESVLKRLPLFRAVDGSFVNLIGETFINVGLNEPPPEVFQHYKLIEDPENLISHRTLVNPLDRNGILRQILKGVGCHKHWRYLIEQLSGDETEELQNLVRTASWLPTITGTGVSPEDVIAEPSLETATTAAGNSGSKLVHKNRLIAELLEHPNWSKTESSYCLKGEALIKAMANAVASLPEYQVGINGWREDRLRVFVDLLSNMPTPLPGVQLAAAMLELSDVSLEQLERELFPKIAKPVQLNFVVELLNYIRGKCVSSATRRQHLQIHDAFLDEALGENRFVNDLEQLCLLSQSGEWTPTVELAKAGHNISERNLIHSSHRNVLSKHSQRFEKTIESRLPISSVLGGEGFTEEQIRLGVAVLDNYLCQWKGTEVPGDAIASILAILGDGVSTRAMSATRKRHLGFEVGFSCWQVIEGLLMLLDA